MQQPGDFVLLGVQDSSSEQEKWRVDTTGWVQIAL